MTGEDGERSMLKSCYWKGMQVPLKRLNYFIWEFGICGCMYLFCYKITNKWNCQSINTRRFRGSWHLLNELVWTLNSNCNAFGGKLIYSKISVKKHFFQKLCKFRSRYHALPSSKLFQLIKDSAVRSTWMQVTLTPSIFDTHTNYFIQLGAIIPSTGFSSFSRATKLLCNSKTVTNKPTITT